MSAFCSLNTFYEDCNEFTAFSDYTFDIYIMLK